MVVTALLIHSYEPPFQKKNGIPIHFVVVVVLGTDLKFNECLTHK